MFNTTIRSRVMKIINEKISEAQERHDNKVKELKAQLEIDIEVSEQQEANSIINNFLK